MDKKTLNRGYAAALASALILAWTGIFISYLTRTYRIPSLVLAYWRELFVVLVLLVALGIFRLAPLRVNRKQLGFLAWYGLALAVFNSLWTLAVAFSGAAVATVLVYSSGAFTALLGWLLFRERLDWVKGLAVILCLGGCLLVSGAADPAAWAVNGMGIITGILSGLLYAVYSLMGRAAAEQHINPWTTILYTFGFASCILLAVNLLPLDFIPGSAQSAGEMLWLDTQWQGWGILFLLAAGPTVLGFGVYNVSLGYLPSSVANLIVTLEPVFTSAIAFLLLGETMDGVQISGSFLILGGVLLMRGQARWLERHSQPAEANVPAAVD
ncbi:MAG: EamA family transporter [Anaerolineae bacterium]|nr:EamA family transporter [Anaerolineae bacterium]